MRDVFPCGACRAYVPMRTGCEHWRLGPSRRQKARESAAAVAGFRRQMRLP